MIRPQRPQAPRCDLHHFYSGQKIHHADLVFPIAQDCTSFEHPDFLFLFHRQLHLFPASAIQPNTSSSTSAASSSSDSSSSSSHHYVLFVYELPNSHRTRRAYDLYCCPHYLRQRNAQCACHSHFFLPQFLCFLSDVRSSWARHIIAAVHILVLRLPYLQLAYGLSSVLNGVCVVVLVRDIVSPYVRGTRQA